MLLQMMMMIAAAAASDVVVVVPNVSLLLFFVDDDDDDDRNEDLDNEYWSVQLSMAMENSRELPQAQWISFDVSERRR